MEAVGEEAGMRSSEVKKTKRQYTRRLPVPREQLPRDMWLVEHVAQFLGRSHDWVYDKTAAGVLPHRKLTGGRLVFIPDEVDAWWRAQPGFRGITGDA